MRPNYFSYKHAFLCFAFDITKKGNTDSLHINLRLSAFNGFIVLLSYIGTCKIEYNCTSTIQTEVSLCGTVAVEICYTHYGHQEDLQHIWLTKRQRKNIAAKLQQGVTITKILDDIRNSVGEKFEKVHLVDKRDIRNIGNAFEVDEIQRHKNDQDSVLSWINEWRDSPQNPVLFYKLQGNYLVNLNIL